MKKIYVLIHPEQSLSSSPESVDPYCYLDNDELDDAINTISNKALSLINEAHKAYCVVDPMDVEFEFDELPDDLNIAANETDWEVMDNVPAKNFTLFEADAFGVELITKTIAEDIADVEDTLIIVGGYHRNDCVARAIKTFEFLGYKTKLSEETTLPLVFE